MKYSDPKRYDIYLANLDPTLGSEIKKTRSELSGFITMLASKSLTIRI